MNEIDLFNEPFKPVWMQDKERYERESLEKSLQVEVDYAWRRAAYACYDRIIAHHYCPKIPTKARKPYNPRYTLKEFV
jgi:hypothetical protein